MQHLDDKELLVLLKKGSIESYEILFERYYKVLCIEAFFILREKVAAEDLVQDFFIEFWDKKIYRKIKTNLKVYIYQSIKNKCFNALKKEQIIKKRKKEYAELMQHKSMPKWLEEKELATSMNNILGDLPCQRLKAFTLVYMENKKYQEAADEMGISINSIKTHLRLALKVLRNKLEYLK